MENTVDKEVASQAYHDEPPLHADLNAMKSKSFMESFSREFQNISISSGRRRRKLIIGLLCLLIATLMVYFGHSSSYRQVLSWNHPSDPTPIYLGPAVPFKIHPIVQLVAENEAKFSKLVNKQSKTLKEAVKEYRQRYGRHPPPKFDKWFALAQKHDLIMIDEFDVMMKGLEPYWGVNPVTLSERFESRAQDVDDITIITFNSSGTFNNKDSFQYDVMKTWLADMPWQEMVHSVEIAHGRPDEPAVNVAYDVLQSALELASTQKSSIDGPSPPLQPGDPESHAINMHGLYAWEYMLDSCQPSDPAMMRIPAEHSEMEPLQFINDIAKSMDPCLNPYLHKHYAMFMSPGLMFLTKHLVPLMSQSRATRFNDVLYPAPFYYTESSLALEELEDQAWDQKLNRAYWVGSPWGGDIKVNNWRDFQRQRMVLQLAPENRKPVHLLELHDKSDPNSGYVRQSGTIWADLASYFHVRMAPIGKCPAAWDPVACEQQADVLKPQSEPAQDAYGSKYVLDLDGKSFSGRYYRLLKSNSAVMKQTIMEEWHDDWLVPWVHYIPITLEAKELGEVTRFLVEEQEGQEIGKKIATQSKEWSRSILRKQDASVWFIRLLMEMERLMSADRNDLFYEG